MSEQNVRAEAWSTLEWIRDTPRIAIPVYQREYRWSQSTCDTLLQDVRHIAAQPPGQTHFLGSILAKPDRAGGVTLVDGQQRITTLMLLVAAIGARAREVLGSEPEGLRELLADGRDPHATRLVPHERSAAEFHQLVLGSSESEGDDSTNAFGNNYAFLAERIRDDWMLIWEGLARLEHVTIELKSSARAEQIFESLNSKGAALADDELIHNYVHMGREHDQQVELERETWLPIEDATAGSTREFWRDYLVLTSDTVPDFSGDFGVYRAFKTRYPYPLDDVTPECTAEWRRYAQCYRALLNPDVEPDALVAKQLWLLQTFGGSPRPLVMAVYDDFREGNIDVNTAVSTFEQLQTMLMRRSLVGGARDLHRIAGLCRELAARGYPIAGIVTHTPKDALIRRTLVHAGLPHATYALRRLQFDDRLDLDLQVEHIYPQTPDKDWSGGVGTTKWGDLTSDEQAEYRALLHTAGNLTLLEADLNQGAGNRPFVEKSGYFRQSAVPETKALAQLSLWNPGAIQDRTRDLTDRFLTVWPRRSDAPESDEDDLVTLADVPRPDVRGYPEVFEYAEFNGEPWEYVHTSKQLFVRLVNELCAIDEAMVESSSLGRLVAAERTPHVSYEKLENGKWVYTGLWHSYMLRAVESALADFGLEGKLRVKLAAPLDE
jgi:hypothetical protein